MGGLEMTVEAGRPIVNGSRVAADRQPLWAMGSGVMFAVLFVVGMIVGRDTPEGDASDEEWLQWFADSGNRWQQVIAALALALAAMALVVFIAHLVHHLDAGNSAGAVATRVAHSAGIVLAAAIAIGGVGMNYVAAGIEIGELPVPAPDVPRTAEHLGFGVMLIVGGLFAALMVGAFSIAARGTGTLPGWLVTAGLVVAVLLLASVMYIPIVLLPLWVLVVAIILGRNSRPSPRA
jgi:hypothetical protein